MRRQDRLGLSMRGVFSHDRNRRTLEELKKLGAMTTPVIVIGGQTVIGFNQKRLEELLS
jgi:glutaredoxin